MIQEFKVLVKLFDLTISDLMLATPSPSSATTGSQGNTNPGRPVCLVPMQEENNPAQVIVTSWLVFRSHWDGGFLILADIDTC